MKYMISLAIFGMICAVARAEDVCYNNIKEICRSGDDVKDCDAKFGGIERVELDFQKLTNLHLYKSYQYLLLATQFNSYQKDRPGFRKLYQGLSDRSFDDTIDLIKHITRRGGVMDFTVADFKKNTLETNELQSVGLALDFEKELAHETTHLYMHALHNTGHVENNDPNQPRATDSKSHKPDPEIAHFLEEKLLGKQAVTIRQLSGYANDLSKLLHQDDPSLAVYLFDEYLQKQ